MAKNVFFEAKNHKNVDKKVLSWPRVMVDSLKNQKKLVWNDSEKIFSKQKAELAQISKNRIF